MPAKKSNNPLILMVIVILLAALAVLLWIRYKPTTVSKPVFIPQPATPVTETPPVIDYNQLESDETTKNMMAKRKAECGVDKGIDMIAKPDEIIKVGDRTVSMKDILDQIRIKNDDIIESDLTPNGRSQHRYSGVYGIYVVQQTDNIWNIHFKFLKDYFNHKGISLSPLSDEPDLKGFSSGVGKVLKFSENMVYIYHLEEKKLVDNLDSLYPLTKIIVYNMDQVFALLDHIDYNHVNRIQFDGETLWIPAEQ